MSMKKEDKLLLQNVIGKYILTGRQKHQFTQQRLAEESYLTVRNTGKIESAESLPNAQSLIYLIIVLGIDANALIADYKAQSTLFNNK